MGGVKGFMCKGDVKGQKNKVGEGGEDGLLYENDERG